MSIPTAAFAIHGVVDHARADAVAARIRAAVRNGRNTVAIACEPGTVIASPALLAFLLRAATVLRQRGGGLELTGDQAALDPLRDLGILAAIAAKAGQGDAS